MPMPVGRRMPNCPETALKRLKKLSYIDVQMLILVLSCVNIDGVNAKKEVML